MINDDDSCDWVFEKRDAENQNSWEFDSDQIDMPGMTLGRLRDGALALFDDYLAQRTGIQAIKSTKKLLEFRRKFLSVEETENIVKEFRCQDDDLPEGVFAISGRSVEELNRKMRDILHALMNRIMSNLMSAGVNLGLIECAFDSDADAFAFAPSEKGEKLIKRLAKERKKKNKGDDSAD